MKIYKKRSKAGQGFVHTRWNIPYDREAKKQALKDISNDKEIKISYKQDIISSKNYDVFSITPSVHCIMNPKTFYQRYMWLNPIIYLNDIT